MSEPTKEAMEAANLIACGNPEIEIKCLAIALDAFAEERCEKLRQLADQSAHESGLYARRMGEAQAQRDAARARIARMWAVLEQYLYGHTDPSMCSWDCRQQHDGLRAVLEKVQDDAPDDEKSHREGARW